MGFFVVCKLELKSLKRWWRTQPCETGLRGLPLPDFVEAPAFRVATICVIGLLARQSLTLRLTWRRSAPGAG